MKARNTASQLRLKPRFKALPAALDAFVLYGPGESAYRIRADKLDLFSLFEGLTAGISAGRLPAVAKARRREARAQLDGILERLDGIGALETRPATAGPGREERLRFDRELRYFDVHTDSSSADCLASLRGASVLLLGVGGLGSWVLQHLAASGIGRITLVDDDRISESNLSRQCLYGESDVGRAKAPAAAALSRRLSRFTRVSSVQRRIGSSRDILRLFGERGPFSLVILTADEPSWKISLWAARSALKLNVPLLRGNHLGVGPFYIPGKTACPGCDWPRLERRFPEAPALVARMRNSPLMKQKAALSTELSVAGALLAHEAIRHLSNAGGVETYDAKIRVSLAKGARFTRVEFPRDKECPVCGEP